LLQVKARFRGHRWRSWDQTFFDQVNVGLDFDQSSRSDDFFYIPREGFDNEAVKTGMQLLMSPDGQAARIIVTHEGDANGPEDVQHVEHVSATLKWLVDGSAFAGQYRQDAGDEQAEGVHEVAQELFG
jgi:RND superfamily putative drug exporter